MENTDINVKQEALELKSKLYKCAANPDRTGGKGSPDSIVNSFCYDHFFRDDGNLKDGKVLLGLMRELFVEYQRLGKKARKANKKMAGDEKQNIRPFVLSCLAKVFEIMPFWPEYDTCVQNKLITLAKVKAGDHVVQQARLNWRRYPEYERKKVLFHMIALQDRIFSGKGVQFEPHSNVILSDKKSEASAGYFLNTITLYKRCDNGRFWNNFNRVDRALQHEEHHRLSDLMVWMFQSGELPGRSEYYRQAGDFQSYCMWKNLGDRIVLNPDYIYFTAQHAERVRNLDLYYQHPAERDARRVGGATKLMSLYL